VPNVDIHEVSSIIPMVALDFIENYNLKPRDAFHMAIMKELNLTSIVSDDIDFDRVKKIKRINLE